MSSVFAGMKPLLGVGQKPVPRGLQGTASQGPFPDSCSLPDVSGTGNLMSARSFGQPRRADAAAQQLGTAAASSDAGTSCAPIDSCAAHVQAASVSITQAGAFPVRQGSNGTPRSARRSLTMEGCSVSCKPLDGRRSSGAAKQPVVPMEIASTALQLTGAPICSFGGNAAGVGAQRVRSSDSSVGSASDRLVSNSLLCSSQLSEGTGAPSGTESDDGSMIAAGKALAPRRHTSLTLGNGSERPSSKFMH